LGEDTLGFAASALKGYVLLFDTLIAEENNVGIPSARPLSWLSETGEKSVILKSG